MPWVLIETDRETAEVNWVEPYPTQHEAIEAAVRDAIVDGVRPDTPEDRSVLYQQLMDEGSYINRMTRINVAEIGARDAA